MRTLTSLSNISSNYLLTGNDPRTVVYIPDAGLALTTTLKSSGTIIRTAKPFGGYEQAATLSISNLELGETVKLCTESTRPRYDDHATLRGAGQVIRIGVLAGTYLDNRNGTTGILSDPTMTIGQQYSSGFASPRIFRGFLQFRIPLFSTCEEATIYLPGLSKYSLSDFEIVVVGGTWSSLTTGLFNDFTGWQATGDYTDYITELNETYSTSEFFEYDESLDEDDRYCHIRLNRAGRDLIETNSGGILRLMLLSRNDIEATEPTGDEFVIFTAPTATLRLRYNTKKLDNKRVYVYRYFGDTAPAYSGMLELFRGVVQSHRLSLRTLDLDIKRDEGKVNVVLPKTALTEESYPYVPDNNIGLKVPIVYGDFLSTPENTLKFGSCLNETDSSNRYGDSGLVKAILIKYTDTDVRLLLAGHALKAIGFFVALWESEVYAPITGDVSVVSGAEVKIVKGDVADFPYYLTDNKDATTNIQAFVIKAPSRYEEGVNVANPENAMNKDATDWTVFEDTGTQKYVEYHFNQPWGNISSYDAIYVTLETLADSYVSNQVSVNITYLDDNGTSDSVTHYVNANGQTVIRVHSDQPGYDYDPSKTMVNLVVTVTVSSTATFPLSVRNVCVSRGISADFPNIAYMGCQGRADDGSGTVTGTASKLIENPAHVVESLARSEMGLVAAELDTGDLDTAAGDLTGWELAFQQNEQIRGIEWLDQIGEESKQSLFRDEYDRLTSDVWDETRGFAHSGTDVPADLDIFQPDPVVTSEAVTRNPLMNESLVIDQVPIHQVYNSFELHYSKNYATNGHRDVITMDNGEGTVGSVDTTLVSADEAYMANGQTITGLKTLCAESYTNTEQVTNQLSFKADHIRDRATAVKLFQHLVEAFAPRRYTVEFTTRENALWVEFGDRINVRHSRVYEKFGRPTAYKKKWAVYGVRHVLRTGEMTFRAIEAKPER